MNAFLALIRKDILLYVQDRRALLLNLVMPIVLAVFFGFIMGGGSQNKPSKIAVALVQQDDSAVSKKIAAGLAADANLAITTMSLDEATALVRKGKVKVAIVLPQGFGGQAGAAMFNAGKKPQITLLYDPSENAVLAMVNGMLTQHVMQTVSAEVFGGQGSAQLLSKGMQQLEGSAARDPDSVALKNLLGEVKRYQERPAKAGAGGAAGPAQAGLSSPFSTKSEPVTNNDNGKPGRYNGYAHSFGGMSVQFILFMGIDMGIGILLARRSGIWSRLLAAPVSLSHILLARVASATLIGSVLLLCIFGVGRLFFGVDIGNPVGFAVVAISFAFLTACFGLLIASLGKTPEAARGISIFATLIMVMLGGAWVPSFFFPQWMQDLTLFIPTRWAVDGFDAMTWRGLGMDSALLDAGALLGFAVLFGLLAIWKFRREQV